MNPVRRLSLTVTSNVALIPLVCLLLFGSGVAFGQVIFTVDTYIGPSNTTYDNEDIIVDGCVLTVDGAHPFNSLQLINGAVVTHSPAPYGEPDNRLDLTIATDVTIDAGSQIDANGRGYAPDWGPGAGGPGGGAGHAGEGGAGEQGPGGSAYGMDSVTGPTALGSGGGSGFASSGGAGGGKIRLIVTGTLQVYGQLSANGATGSGYHGGGGSGGSVYVTTGTLAGDGTIAAFGGGGGVTGYSGGGGAGRVAVEYTANTFAGTTYAYGGAGRVYGGAGTIYAVASTKGAGNLLVDNAGIAGAWTPLTSPVAFNLTVGNGATVYPTAAITVGDLAIAAGGLLTHPPGGPGLDVTTQGDATVDAAGAINANSIGYAADTGPGAGDPGGGAGHGGEGGAGEQGPGGSAYGMDSVTGPTELGSGGGSGSASTGGAGGGAIRLFVSGTLQLDGPLTANGATGSGYHGGGGSGGSVWIETGTLAGAGVVSAGGGTGGQTSYSGGGGGGRIAIQTDIDNFAGTISACGGDGAIDGGAGSVYILHGAGPADLSFDNCGSTGAWTPMTTPAVFGVTIGNAAIVYPAAPLLVGDLDVEDGGLLTQTPGSADFDIEVQGDMTVEYGGAVSANGCGYGAGGGPGAGSGAGGESSGAGYGGRGGDASNGVSGGDTYGFEMKPEYLGSGGGSSGPNSAGGAGGGLLLFRVDGALQVDGVFSANGANGTGIGGGGGSGGGLSLHVGTLDGSGSISANGGEAGNVSYSGGGGGGRIAIFSCDVLMPLEQITATGGAGWQNGEDGTIFFGSGTVEILQQPQGGIAFVGDSFVFEVVATGNGPLSYQWRQDGVDLVDDGRITGALTDTLSIDPLVLTDMGDYDVLVTDDCGPFPSDSAFLIVPPPGDMNCDGVTNAFDIDPFVLALTNPAGYAAVFPDCDRMLADINGDGVVNAFDIDPFVELLVGG